MNEITKKEPYEKPESGIVNIEVEQPILAGSGDNWGNGGWWD